MSGVELPKGRGSDHERGRLTSLVAGQMVPFGGDRYVQVSAELASSFVDGDRLVVVQESGDLIHIEASVARVVDEAVSRAVIGFERLATTPLAIVDDFYDSFARLLSDDEVFESIKSANENDVDDARLRGRSIGRLQLTEKMRVDMIEALRMWRDLPDPFSGSTERIEHESWTVEERRSPLGVIGFVFEGRPNVFADATGVLKSGNSVVFRIGSDALGTARALMRHCVIPACHESGLAVESITLVDAAERSAGHALFSDPRLALAVARGSGEAVAQLGAVARQSGVPVSLHGTGGAWMYIAPGFGLEPIEQIVEASLDRKVCNTVNVIAVPASARSEHEAVLSGIVAAAERRGCMAIVHMRRSEFEIWGGGNQFETIVHDDDSFLATEWEWDDRPEVSVVTVGDSDESTELFNRYSPKFVLAVLTKDPDELERLYRTSEAPFVGDGFTRWVDGQYALGRPELGLSNWQSGRLFGRGGILSGDGVYSVRYLARHRDSSQRR